MRDSQCHILYVKRGLIGSSNATQAEIIGLSKGLRMLKSNRLKDCIVEGNLFDCY